MLPGTSLRRVEKMIEQLAISVTEIEQEKDIQKSESSTTEKTKTVIKTVSLGWGIVADVMSNGKIEFRKILTSKL